jgi:hypothetical protein
MEYRLTISGQPGADGKLLIFQSTIERSTDGTTWEQATTYVDRFDPTKRTDDQIIVYLKKRANDYAMADANRITKTDLQARSDAISSALSGMTKTY